MKIQCTAEEIAAVLGFSVDTLSRAVRDEFGISFAEYAEQKRMAGRASLRRAQWMKALGRTMVIQINPDGTREVIEQPRDPDSSMLMFLGKNILGQRNVWDDGVRGSAGDNVLVEEPVKALASVLASFSKQEIETIIKSIPASTENGGEKVDATLHAVKRNGG